MVWTRLDSGTVAVSIHGTTAGPGSEMCILHNGQVRIVVGIPGFGARHVLQASPVFWETFRSLLG